MSQQKNAMMKLISGGLLERGWSQKDLSEKSGVSESSISRLINDGKQISTNNIFKILKGLALIGGKGGNEGMEERERERYEKQIAMYERHIERLEKQIDGRLAPMTEGDEFVRKRSPGED